MQQLGGWGGGGGGEGGEGGERGGDGGGGWGRGGGGGRWGEGGEGGRGGGKEEEGRWGEGEGRWGEGEGRWRKVLIKSCDFFQVVSDPVGYGFVIRGSRPVYVHTIDPSGPAAAAGLKVRLEESREEGRLNC